MARFTPRRSQQKRKSKPGQGLNKLLQRRGLLRPRDTEADRERRASRRPIFGTKAGGRPSTVKGSSRMSPEAAPAPEVSSRAVTPRISELTPTETRPVAPTRPAPAQSPRVPLKPVAPEDPVTEEGQAPTMPSFEVEDVTNTPINIPEGDPFEEPTPTFDVTPEFWAGQLEVEPPVSGRKPIFGYTPSPSRGGRDAVVDLFDPSQTMDARRLQQQGQLPKGVSKPSVPVMFPQLVANIPQPQEAEENPIWARLRAQFGDAAIQRIIDEADAESDEEGAFPLLRGLTFGSSGSF
tara:strand:+ start:438 stop:1316 length:879 start_codon:yes stop_codon:yes gene_type:complete